MDGDRRAVTDRSPDSQRMQVPRPDPWQPAAALSAHNGLIPWRAQQDHFTTMCARWSLFLESWGRDSSALGVGEALAPGGLHLNNKQAWAFLVGGSEDRASQHSETEPTTQQHRSVPPGGGWD
jgi:hypothetical protein